MVVDVIKKILLSFVLILLSIQSVFAEMMEKGKTKVKTLLNIYSQKSKSGKQVFDNSGNEDLFVIEPMVFVKHQINEDTEINANFVFDTWTAESDTIIDGLTGASGEKAKKGQSRIAPNFGMRKEIDKNSMGFNLGFSNEYDYQSKNISLDFERKFAEDNFTLGASFQYYADEVKVFNDLTPPQTATISKGQKRDIWAINLSASQILTRRDLVLVGVTSVGASGKMESTAGTIKVGGTREVEVLPNNRDRNAYSAKWIHAITDEIALNLSERYYKDDWGLEAYTSKAALLFSLRDDLDYLELSLRVHTQNSVDYYKNEFQTQERYMTSDSDLSKFTSIEPTVTYSRSLEDLKLYSFDLKESEWTSGLMYSKRNTGLSAVSFQTGLSFYF